MKLAIICPVCYKPRKYSDTYAMRIIDYTQEPKVIDETGKKAKAVYGESKVRVCKICARRIGYKVKIVKKKK